MDACDGNVCKCAQKDYTFHHTRVRNFTRLRQIIIKLAELPNKILNQQKNDDIKLMK